MKKTLYVLTLALVALFQINAFATTQLACDAYITNEGNQLVINNLTDPQVSVQIRDTDWNLIWKCDPWIGACQATEVIDFLPTGEYLVSIQTFTADWEKICDIFGAQTITNECEDQDNDGICVSVDCNDNNPNLPAVKGTPCDDGNAQTIDDVILEDGCTCQGEAITACSIEINNDGKQLTLSGLDAPIVAIQISDKDWNKIWSCDPWTHACSSSEIISGLPAGEYIVSVQAFTADWGKICDIFKRYEIGANGGITEMELGNTLKFTVSSNVIQASVYPNPAQNLVNIGLNNNIPTDIVIVNQFGQTIYQVTEVERSISVNTSNFNKGIYFIQFKNQLGYQTTKRLVVQ